MGDTVQQSTNLLSKRAITLIEKKQEFFSGIGNLLTYWLLIRVYFVERLCVRVKAVAQC